MRRFFGLCLAMALLVGCNQQDRECLSKVGKKMIEAMEDTASTSPDPLASGIQAVRGAAGPGNLDGRVVLRLRWERDLAGCCIRVRVVGPTAVQLEGLLKDESQRTKALEVARATSGVETVEDKLQMRDVPPPEPEPEPSPTPTMP